MTAAVRDNAHMSRNSAMKSILVRGQPLAGDALPAICIPLVGRTDDALLQEAAAAAAKRPDLLEWRVDFYEGIADLARVAALAPRLRDAAAGIPLLFTRRSPREGGQQCALREDQVPALYAAACASGAVDLVDAEMASDPQQLDALRVTRAVTAAGCCCRSTTSPAPRHWRTCWPASARPRSPTAHREAETAKAHRG